MSDTSARNAVSVPQLLADALLRNLNGSTAELRVTGSNTDATMPEIGLVSTIFFNVVLSPVVMRKLRPHWVNADVPQWEMLVSATSVQAQVNALQLDSAQSLFGMTLMVTVGDQEYLIEKVTSNEAFGNVYLYRLLLKECRQQAV